MRLSVNAGWGRKDPGPSLRLNGGNYSWSTPEKNAQPELEGQGEPVWYVQDSRTEILEGS